MKRIIGWVCVAVLMVAIPVAWATVIKDSMVYEGAVTFLNNITQTGNLTVTGDVTTTGTLTHTGDIANTGDITNTGNIDVTEGVFTSGTTALVSSGVTIALTAEYNHVTIDRHNVTVSGVTLPAATAALDGYCLDFKIIDAGSTVFYLWTANTNDQIERTRGTFTGLVDSTMDAAGDYKAFRLDWRSGVSPVWLQSSVNQS